MAPLGACAHQAALAAEGWSPRGLSNVDAFICSVSLVPRRPSEQTSSLLMLSERRAKRMRCSSRVLSRRRTAMPCSSSNRIEHASRRLTLTLIARARRRDGGAHANPKARTVGAHVTHLTWRTAKHRRFRLVMVSASLLTNPACAEHRSDCPACRASHESV